MTAIAVHPDVQSFLSASRGMLVNGQWTDSLSGKRLTTFNPAPGEALVDVGEARAEDADRAVGAVRVALESGPWCHMTLSMRGQNAHPQLGQRGTYSIPRDVVMPAGGEPSNRGKHAGTNH